MRGFRSGHVTGALVSALAVTCLATATYKFLESPAPAGETARTAAVVTGSTISLNAESLASMKASVMGYDIQHYQQADATTATPAAPPKPAVVVQAPAVQPSSPPPAAPVYHTAGFYSSAMVEALWIQEGGSPATAGDDACIVSHESGGNPNAISPTADYGLDQIHDDPAALNPVVSTQVAIRMSNNGTNWSPWTTAGMCGL